MCTTSKWMSMIDYKYDRFKRSTLSRQAQVKVQIDGAAITSGNKEFHYEEDPNITDIQPSPKRSIMR